MARKKVSKEKVNGIVWHYIVSDGEATVCKMVFETEADKIGAVSIPAELGGCPVVGIGEGALLEALSVEMDETEACLFNDYEVEECCECTSITIPASVRSIGRGAFHGSDNLKSISVAPGNVNYKTVNGLLLSHDGINLISGVNGDVVVPDGVRNIGDYAFCRCRGLASITIPDSVTRIGDSAFEGCGSFSEITIPEGVTSIGKNAFYGCKDLEDLTIPGSVTCIGAGAFNCCRSLTDITVPDSVTSFGDSVFADCKHLRNVTLPDGLTDIGVDSFTGCEELCCALLPASITSIPYRAFADCCSLADITIPDGVEIIEAEAFDGCDSLSGITIPKSVRCIGDYAFNGCCNLKSMTIPDSVKEIGNGAFPASSVRLKEVSVVPGKGKAYLKMENGVLKHISCGDILWVG